MLFRSLRAAVAREPLLRQPQVDNTVSVGLACRVEGELPDALLQRADAALYEAKRNDKGRVATKESALIRDLLAAGRGAR